MVGAMDLNFGNRGLLFYNDYSTASASDFTWEPIASNELVVINSNELARYPTFVVLENDNSDLLTPKSPKLFNPYPNPFNGRISLSFDVDMLESSSISIYTIAGKKVFDRKMRSIR